MHKALFLDRDGLLIVDKDYLKDPAGVELLPHARDFLLKAIENGYKLFLFSNQSGIARGYYTWDDVHACNQRMMELLDLPEPGFTELCMAPEGPSDEQVYRKPSPKFILEMIEKHRLDASECWMIGDKLSDLQSGVNGGIKTAWVGTGKAKNAALENFIKEHNVVTASDLQAIESAVLSASVSTQR